MKKLSTIFVSLIFAFMLVSSAWAQNYEVQLWDYGINVNGVISWYDGMASGVSVTGLNVYPTAGTPFGSMTYTFNVGPGTYFVSGYFDESITLINDEGIPSLIKDDGAGAAGFLGNGQPVTVNGNILSFGAESVVDVLKMFKGDSTYKNNFDAPIGGNIYQYTEDIALSLSWQFTLGANEEAVITFAAQGTAPNRPYYIFQASGTIGDDDQVTGWDQPMVYMYSDLDIRGTNPDQVPEPSTLLLLSAGLLGLVGWRRK
jgi:hypothetical protein